jgi:hypothetical protein
LIRLFTSSFDSPDEGRRAEFAEALDRNLACDAIDVVCVLDEGARDLPVAHPKIRVRVSSTRPTYRDYFSWINELAGPDDVSILANADIYFGDHLFLFRHWLPPGGTALALARWEPDENGTFLLRDRNDSQDAWIFRGPIRNIDADFPVGVPGCDNRLASELASAGFEVLNPSFSLKSFHLHAGERLPWIGDARAGGVEPPYAYIWPHNLWPLYRTLLHNVRHPSARVGWRFDARLWKRRLKVHWIVEGWQYIVGAAGERPR